MENRTGDWTEGEFRSYNYGEECEKEEKIGFCSGSAEKLLRQFSFSFLIIMINN